MFNNFPEAETTGGDKFQLEIAEKCLQKLIPDLVRSAGNLLDHESIPAPSQKSEDLIYKRFAKFVPPQNVLSLADIINAGWRVYEDIGEKDSKGLKELILKTVEIFEIERILEEQTILDKKEKELRQTAQNEIVEAEQDLQQENQPSLFEYLGTNPIVSEEA